MRFSQLRDKEIFCIKDGQKIGYLDDFELDSEQYRIEALVCYGKPRLFGLFGRSGDIRIPVEQICVIGEDSILVNHESVVQEARPTKRSFFYQLFE